MYINAARLSVWLFAGCKTKQAYDRRKESAHRYILAKRYKIATIEPLRGCKATNYTNGTNN
jgi:hypothetical protein